MADEFMNRLRAADPSATTQPDVDALRAKVFAHVDDNIVSLRPRGGAQRWLRVAAAVGLLSLAAGGGYWGGTARQPMPTTITSDAAVPGVETKLPGGAATADSRVSSYMGYWGGGTELRPGSGVTNTAGAAAAYTFSDEGIDRKALLRKLLTAVGIDTDAPVTDDQGTLYINDEQGRFNAYVGSDAQVWFNAYNAQRSPWACGQSTAPEGGKDIASAPDCLAEWKAPSKADAITAAKQVFAALGADVAAGRFDVAAGGENSVSVTFSPTILAAGSDRGAAAMQTQTYWSAEVSKAGVFSVGGTAAKVVELASYPTVGARDAALRSLQTRWAFAGPRQVWNPGEAGVVGNDAVQPTPAVPQRDGKPVVTAYLNIVNVDSAVRSLMQVSLVDGTSVLMPAWTYTAADGTEWQMLAITDAFVEWSAQPTGGVMPMAR